ncbi:MAG TPA: LysM peptidoglycan-binding domain-containing protein [Pirellulales bacterium]|nr:LysM peptidoglycan-binding domain-containing protein [Pirellulales bacterium]
MGKEVKIGLGVIGVLLCIFGGVLAMRLKREHPSTAQERVAAAEKEGKIPKADKKATEKPGKGSKDGGGPSFGGGLNRLSSRSRHDRSEPTDTPKTDRYGRPLDDEPPADLNQPSNQGDSNSFNDNQTDQQQTEAPDPRLSPYSRDGSGDRFGRYNDRDTEAIDDQNGPADPADDDAGGADLSMPADRYSQRAEGVSFSEVTDGGANDTEEQPSDAPRFSMDQTVDTAANEDVVERELAGDEQSNRDDADSRFEPLAGDDDLRPAANDRFRDRLNDDRMLRDSSPAATDLVDEADARVEEPVDDRPRRLQPVDGDTYTVEPNDNFWRISQKVYGTGAYFKALEAHNRQQFGDRPLINVGDAISVPPVTMLQEKYPDLSPKPRKLPTERRNTALVSSPARGGKTYTVAEGDTLFDIARQELGKASRWAEIYDLNRDQVGEDFNYLSPGTQLAMPARDNADPVATRSRDRALTTPGGAARGTYRR